MGDEDGVLVARIRRLRIVPAVLAHVLGVEAAVTGGRTSAGLVPAPRD